MTQAIAIFGFLVGSLSGCGVEPINTATAKSGFKTLAPVIENISGQSLLPETIDDVFSGPLPAGILKEDASDSVQRVHYFFEGYNEQKVFLNYERSVSNGQASFDLWFRFNERGVNFCRWVSINERWNCVGV